MTSISVGITVLMDTIIPGSWSALGPGSEGVNSTVVMLLGYTENS